MGRRTGIAIALILAGTAGAALLRPADPAAAALAAHLDQPGDAGVGLTLRAHANIGATMRSRAWTQSAPGQPNGVALFTALPDAAFGPERTVSPAELAPTLARIRGLRWDAAAQAWSDPAAIRKAVTLAEVREGFESACAWPADARAVVDLLTGSPGQGAVDVAERLVARGEQPPLLHVVTFSGRHGALINEDSPPPYRTVERSYEGLMLRFDGAGWPNAWRVAELRVTGR